MTQGFDVIVVGGGNAALCAAISAAENKAKVLVLECAPKNWRGGNSIHTRNMRICHARPTSILTETYSAQEYWDDLQKVTKGETNEALARLVISHSENLCEWLEKHNIFFQKSISGTLSLSRTNAFFLAGGKTLVNSQYQRAEQLGVVIKYRHEVVGITISHGEKVQKSRVESLTVKTPSGTEIVSAPAIVVASGGFESNRVWLKEILGDDEKNYIVRGTRFNNGAPIKSLLAQGVQHAGKKEQFHCVAVDGRAPAYDGGIVTRLDCIPFGIVLNSLGKRFYDEGEDFWPKRYAIWGRKVAAQPGGLGYVIIDNKSLNLFMPSVFPPSVAHSLKDLLAKLNLPKQAEETIKEFNASVAPGMFNPAKLDRCTTKGLHPEKTNWARRIDSPPYYGYTLRPGITFTYLGVKVNDTARVATKNGSYLENLFAAGEIMVGNLLGQGYLAGFGMTVGSVFGIIAGKEAAKQAKHSVDKLPYASKKLVESNKK